MKCWYLRLHNELGELGRANVYLVDTDFASMDHNLSAVRKTIKRWYPNFMNMKTVECGYFTMLGEGLVLAEDVPLSEALLPVIQRMEDIADGHNADIIFIRDIPVEKYTAYRDILQPLGYYPTLGFANTHIKITWNSIDEYYASFRSKKRYNIKSGIKSLRERFNVTCEFVDDYNDLVPILTRLWLDVHERAKDYTREVLNEEFFYQMNTELPDNSEVIVLRHHRQVVAIALNIYDNENYICLDAGIDYSFVHYEKADLFRMIVLLCLERVIEGQKKNFELGITNYFPKMSMGAKAEPLVYFFKHCRTPKYSRVLAKLISENIQQPDNTIHKPFKDTSEPPVDIDALALKIKKDQNDFSDKDIFCKVSEYHKADDLRLAGIYGLYPEFKSAQKPTVTLENGKKVILLGTNSYLGAATHPDVIEAAKNALEEYGSGCSGSPLLNGTLDLHNLLERELAQFLNREAVVLCSTGYQTNLAGISALCAPGDCIILDERSHRSLFDGARLSGADFFVYRHNNMKHLEKMLSRIPTKRKLIVTDSVFSMEGTIPDLKTVCRLAKQYHARVFVDEAHAVGVFGANGRGMCEQLGVDQEVDLIMSTFSKSFASIGGFIAGKHEVIDYIKHRAGGHIFSASLPPAVIATVRAVLKIIREQPELRENILEKARFMAESLHEMGYNARYLGTQIVPVIFGNDTLAFAAYKRFMECGVYVNPVGPPAVPKAFSGFRTSYIATHQWEELQAALEVFDKHKKDFVAR